MLPTAFYIGLRNGLMIPNSGSTHKDNTSRISTLNKCSGMRQIYRRLDDHSTSLRLITEIHDGKIKYHLSPVYSSTKIQKQEKKQRKHNENIREIIARADLI